MNHSLTPVSKLACFFLTVMIMLAPIAQQPVAQEMATGAVDSSKPFSQQELDELLAPIALYPDALLAQVLMASTYPKEVVEVARWQKANPDLKEKALEDALQKESWDPAVKSIAAVPQVLTMMDEQLDWTQKLGDAFLAQQEEVMRTVQNLRSKADEAGNLESTPEQTVKTEAEGGQTIVIIESSQPETVYVPVYNPVTIYGPWWYPAPPRYYYYPPGYVAAPGLWFTAGVIVGGAIWGGFHWGRNEININIKRYNSFNRTNINTGRWKHNPSHRKGVAYRDNATARKFNRGVDKGAAKSREQFRGRAEQGRKELKNMDRGQLDKQVRAADRSALTGDRKLGTGDGAGQKLGSGVNRDKGARDLGLGGGTGRDLKSRDTRPATGGGLDLGSRTSGGRGDGRARNGSHSGGFSGAGRGGSTRAASSRGNASLGSRGGGARAGGRR